MAQISTRARLPDTSIVGSNSDRLSGAAIMTGVSLQRVTRFRRKVGRKFAIQWRRASAFVPTGLWELALGVLIASAVVPFVPPDRMNAARTADFLMTAATISGSVLAIAFALSAVLQQGLFGLVPAIRFTSYVADRRQRLAFATMSAAVLLLLAASLLSDGVSDPAWPKWQPWLLRTGVVLVALVFGVVRWQYEHVTRRLNPLSVIAALERDSLKVIESMADYVREVADDVSPSEDTVPKAQIAVWGQMPLNTLEIHVSSLFQLASRLADRSDALAAQRALNASATIIARYLTERRRSSLAVPAGDFYIGITIKVSVCDAMTPTLAPP